LRCAVAVGIASLLLADSVGSQEELPDTDEQVRLALSAAPRHLRAGATVYVLDGDGYRQARTGSNGFHCLIERWDLDVVAPICYDQVGAESTLLVVLFLERRRAAGASEADIKAEIDAGYASGRFNAPRGQGVAYMLSFGGPAPPHVMYYAPCATNESFGGAAGSARGVLPFIYHPGTPRAYIVQLVDRAALERLGNNP
jgi:hypothetical protein